MGVKGFKPIILQGERKQNKRDYKRSLSPGDKFTKDNTSSVYSKNGSGFDKFRHSQIDERSSDEETEHYDTSNTDVRLHINTADNIGTNHDGS